MGRLVPRIGAGHDISCPYNRNGNRNRYGNGNGNGSGTCNGERPRASCGGWRR
jgi:hypothetical protein